MKEAIALKKELAKLIKKDIDKEFISKLESYCFIFLNFNINYFM